MILLGYRGSGKSTIGRRLAELMNMPFVDTDDLIVAAAGQTIRTIFEQNGESYFRDLEAIAVRNACARSAVIALGGGAVLREENRNCLLGSAHPRIYLRCDPRVLHDRIHADQRTIHSRPSLTHLGGGIEEIRSLLAIREQLYRAVMTDEIDVSTVSAEQVAHQLAGRHEHN
jgi:shikimate kinase